MTDTQMWACLVRAGLAEASRTAREDWVHEPAQMWFSFHRCVPSRLSRAHSVSLIYFHTYPAGNIIRHMGQVCSRTPASSVTPSLLPASSCGGGLLLFSIFSSFSCFSLLSSSSLTLEGPAEDDSPSRLLRDLFASSWTGAVVLPSPLWSRTSVSGLLRWVEWRPSGSGLGGDFTEGGVGSGKGATSSLRSHHCWLSNCCGATL